MKLTRLLPFLLIFTLALYGCGELKTAITSDNTSSSGGGNNNPGTGGDSGNPDNPANPDNPDNPGTGENPENPENPGGGDNPDNPGGGTGGDNGTTGGSDGIYNPLDPSYDIEPVTGTIKMVVVGVDDGIYYSLDGLTGWTKATGKNGLDLSKSRWISFADLGGGNVVAGSGELKGADITKYLGQGIIISHDYGKTWEQTSVKLGIWQSFTYMGNNIVLAGAGSSESNVNGGGVWRSEDGGKTWTQNTNILDLAVPKFDFASLPGPDNKGVGLKFATVWAISRLSDTSAILSGGTSSCASTPCSLKITFDAGKTWFSAAEQYNINNVGAFLRVKNIGILAANFGNTGISRTLDNDKTGIKWSNRNILADRSFASLTQLKSGTILAGNRNDQAVVGGKGSGIWIGTITKDEWAGTMRLDFSQSNMKQFEWKAVEALEDPNTAIAGCAEIVEACKGIYKSTDDGMNWSPGGLNGISVLAIKSLR